MVSYIIQKQIDEHELRRNDNVDRPQKAQVVRGDPPALTRTAEAREEDYEIRPFEQKIKDEDEHRT